jgi:hypothetical protein
MQLTRGHAHQRESGAVILLAAGCLVASLMPFVYLFATTGSFLPQILPEFISDQLYYLVQMDEVASGLWLLGNPYLLEHADLRSPGLLLPLWIAAAPMLLGISLNGAFALNIFLYTALTASLVYVIGRKTLGIGPYGSSAVALLATLSTHDLIVRPAVMQTIYPVFLLWILCFLLYLRKPRSRHLVWISITMVLAFHMYPHLWMILFAAMALHSALILLERRWPEAQRLCVVWLVVMFLCLPQALLMIRDATSTDPAFADLVFRIAAIRTRVVQPLTLFNLKYLLVSAIALLMLRLRRSWKAEEYGLLIASVAVVGVAVSNVVTGTALEFHMIPWRFSLLLLPLLLAAFTRAALYETSLFPRMIIGFCALLLLMTTVNRIAPRANAFSYMLHIQEDQASASLQRFAPLFQTLRQKYDDPVVVLAPLTLSHYIPANTQHYVVFANPARFHPVPSSELLERFLLLLVDSADRAFIAGDAQVNAYAGVGVSHQRAYLQACAWLPLCDPAVLPQRDVDVIGGDDFLDSTEALLRDIDQSYTKYLDAYHVRLIVRDAASAQNPRLPDDAVAIWQSGDLTLYERGAMP